MSATTKKQRSEAAKKAARTRKRNQKNARSGKQARQTAGRATAKRSRTARKPTLVIDSHRFQIGDEVTVHHPHEVGADQGSGRAPIAAPIEKTEVRKDGAVHLTVDKGAQYVVAGPAGDERPGGEPRYLYLTVTVPK